MKKIGNRSIFFVMILIVVALIVDNSIVSFVTSAGGLRSSSLDIGLFVFMVLLFVSGQYVIHKFIKSEYLDRMNESVIAKSNILLVDRIVVIIQYVLVIILILVILQILLNSSYHIYSLIIAILVSYGLSLLLLAMLAKRFFSWYRSNHNLVVLSYGLAVTLISINAIITIIYLNLEYTDNPAFIKSVRSLTGVFASANVVYSSAYILTSILSFVLTWIATVFLLRHYSRKLGEIKYWVLVSIPLVYFLSQFQPLFLFTFSELRMSDPVLFGIVYTLFFSVTKPLGGCYSE